MKLRSKKMISLLLAASMLFTMSTTVSAEEINGFFPGEVALNSTVETEADITDSDVFYSVMTTGTQPVSGDQILSGNITISTETPETKAEEDNSVPVDKVKKAIAEKLSIKVENNGKTAEYYVKNDALYSTADKKNPVVDSISDNISVSLDKIRSIGESAEAAKDIEYTDKNSVIRNASNKLVTYRVTVKGKSVKEANTVEGEIYIKDHYSGEVMKKLVSINNTKYALLVEYDASVEYRGTRITASSHYMVSGDKAVTGDVDGAVGVAVQFVEISGNGYIPVDGGYDEEGNFYSNYFWQTDNGISLKKPRIYDAKTVKSRDADGAPYFMIPMKYKKNYKNGNGESDKYLKDTDKAALMNKLKSEKFYFNIEPRKISTGLITYNKLEPDKYYIKKLTYSSAKNTLKGNIQFRKSSRNSKTLNERKLTNVGKKLNVISQEQYKQNSSSKNKKVDAYFIYDSNKIILTGVKGYYGTAVIDKNIVIK